MWLCMICIGPSISVGASWCLFEISFKSPWNLLEQSLGNLCQILWQSILPHHFATKISPFFSFSSPRKIVQQYFPIEFLWSKKGGKKERQKTCVFWKNGCGILSQNFATRNVPFFRFFHKNSIAKHCSTIFLREKREKRRRQNATQFCFAAYRQRNLEEKTRRKQGEKRKAEISKNQLY